MVGRLDEVRDPVLQTVPLGTQWGTADPFLFCVHHLDRYPAANEHLGPDADLEARDLGTDFSGSDGWSMYHGSVVAGRHGAVRSWGRAVAHRGSGHRPL